MPPLAKPRNVKSVGTSGGVVPTTDAHERRKDFLTDGEFAAFLTAAKANRHGVRDHAIAFVTCRHALRVSELTDLRMTDLHMAESNTAKLDVRRLKGSLGGMHPIEGDELRVIKAWLRLRPERTGFDHLFLNERKQPFTRQAINYLFKALTTRAGLPHVHPHMLRHTCGYLLAEQDEPFRTMQDYLGHREPAHTARYTRISSSKFRGMFRRKGKS